MKTKELLALNKAGTLTVPVEQWNASNTNGDAVGNLKSWIRELWTFLSLFITCLLLTCFFMIRFRDNTDSGGFFIGVIAAILAVIFCLLWVVFYTDKPNFTQNINDLQKNLGVDWPVIFNSKESELKALTHAKLMSLAEIALRNEDQWGMNSSQAATSKSKFGYAHAAFFRFGWAEEKWDGYFKQAKENIAAK